MIGQTISHYRILSKLGEGGMGVVYRAEDLRLKRFVALKFLHHNLEGDEASRRFVREAQTVSSLEHPNICAIYEIDTTGEGQTFIVMPCYEGESLQAKLSRGPLAIEEAVELGVQVAAGLAKAHEQGIVHRDIKPGNVLVTKDGLAKIVDFGLAKLASQTRVTKTGATLGTVRYMSPEQAGGGEADARSDVWSLGAMLYEMVTGGVPFPGEYDQAVIYAILNEEPKLVTAIKKDVPPELEDIIAKALTKKVEERYQNASEILRDLEDLKQTLSIGRAGAIRRRLSKVAQRRARRKLLLRAGVPVILAVLAAAFYLLRPYLLGEAISAPAPIAVIAFENQTGDSTYDYLCEAIPNLLITSLEQSKHLRVATWQRLGDLLKQVGKEGMEVAAIDRDLGLTVCSQGNINTIVWGSFTRAGEVFVTDAKVIDVRTKESVGSASARGTGIGSILSEQIDDLSARISKTVGAAPLLWRSSGRPVTEVVTTSMEAYNWYLKGYGAQRKGHAKEAEDSYKKALAIDSTIAMAYLHLAEVYFGIDWPKVRETYKKAKQHIGNASEKDQLLIESSYAIMVDADFDKGQKALRELVKRYPNEKDARLELAGYLMYEEEFGAALRELEAAFALDPYYESTLGNLVQTYSYLENYEKAYGYATQLQALKPESPGVHSMLGSLYFRWGKFDEAIAEYEKANASGPAVVTEDCIAYANAFREDYGAAFRLIEQGSKRTDEQDKLSFMFDKAYYLAVCGSTEASLSNIATLRSGGDTLKGNLSLEGILYAEAVVRYLRGEYDSSRTCLDREAEESKKTWEKFEREISYLYGVPHRNSLFCLNDLREGNLRSIRERIQDSKDALVKLDNLGVAGDFGMLTAVTANVCGMLEAELYLAEGDPDKAIRVAHSTPPVGRNAAMWGVFNHLYNNPPVERDVAARAFLKKGEIDKAILEYEALVSIAPEKKDRLLIYPLYHYRLAKLYEQKGRTKPAVEQYGKFLTITKGADIWLGEIADAKARMAKLSAGKG